MRSEIVTKLEQDSLAKAIFKLIQLGNNHNTLLGNTVFKNKINTQISKGWID